MAAHPLAARLTICLKVASSLVMRRRLPSWVMVTGSLSTASKVVAKLRLPRGRPLDCRIGLDKAGASGGLP